MFEFTLRYGSGDRKVDLDTFHINQVEKLAMMSLHMAFFFGRELGLIRQDKPRTITNKCGAGKYKGKLMCEVPVGYLREMHHQAREDYDILYEYICNRRGIPSDGFDAADWSDGGSDWE